MSEEICDDRTKDHQGTPGSTQKQDSITVSYGRIDVWIWACLSGKKVASSSQQATDLCNQKARRPASVTTADVRQIKLPIGFRANRVRGPHAIRFPRTPIYGLLSWSLQPGFGTIELQFGELEWGRTCAGKVCEGVGLLFPVPWGMRRTLYGSGFSCGSKLHGLSRHHIGRILKRVDCSSLPVSLRGLRCDGCDRCGGCSLCIQSASL